LGTWTGAVGDSLGDAVAADQVEVSVIHIPGEGHPPVAEHARAVGGRFEHLHIAQPGPAEAVGAVFRAVVEGAVGEMAVVSLDRPGVVECAAGLDPAGDQCEQIFEHILILGSETGCRGNGETIPAARGGSSPYEPATGTTAVERMYRDPHIKPRDRVDLEGGWW